MAYQAIFQRYELKFILTQQQKQQLLQVMEPYMALDRYGRVTVRNLYFDTDNYRLIRQSIEKPVYKEKLRIRSYRRAAAEDEVFVELKKKYKGVVYKRRISLPQNSALQWLTGENTCRPSGQIAEEIEYFRRFYGGLHPMVFLSYEREAFYQKDGGDFRITFDENILCRREELTLESDARGCLILPEDRALLEVKCSAGIPLWLTEALSRLQIYKTSFSKYGTAYECQILPHIEGGYFYV